MGGFGKVFYSVKNRMDRLLSQPELEKKLDQLRQENLILKNQLDSILLKQEDNSVVESLREASFQQAILIADLRKKEETLKKLVITDGLTGLYNHRHFQQRLRDECDRARRYSYKLSLIMIDIDHFKHYNDTHGHPAGDKVLLRVAEILSDKARQSDIVARYGGEEFAILCHSPLADTVGVAERLRHDIETAEFWGQEQQPLLNGQSHGSLTICLGVAAFGSSMKDPGDLVELADKKLYQAKKAGRNQVVY